MMNIVTHAIVVALGAALVTDMITETATASQQLVTAKAKVIMPNTTTNLDQERNCNQGPVLMVTIFMMLTTGKGKGLALLLLSLV